MSVVKAMVKTGVWMTLFSIAMGFLESVVVVYIRELYYPAGFDFPMVRPETGIFVTEVLREAATIIMLSAVAYIGGRSLDERFAWFLYCFAVWDIFYYGFLKLLLGWPESILTWDILFLIPVAWTGPVITPVIIACTMILLALSILYFSCQQNVPVRIPKSAWILLITGSLVIILSFIWDYVSFVLETFKVTGHTTITAFFQLIYSYIPDRFNWPVYIAGEIIILAGIFRFIHRQRKTTH
ncbi:MAG: hypothetical protein JXA61_03755 [Bacteroidales bacterium]|nr:hypothetical protein [Bacteroidales bacterium]